ncbi:DUF3108 domain-containing protein [Duganella sp. BJB488]|uniref:DUF3108 domain-containing protein n=1 Tax=unclassified Duganella TaxID=2636909 RepID=UPI000E353498|nr:MULTISPECIES: DUF3108 domain-containing protein [unclassified Duganella]RFP13992.1 DUF3108 domain-containing protein [Duganella sp. BJB489]RFP17423.1 DUF3108 domain-containing protein [Duganella sp. BJB488]RFP31787.1 DUF3108 domain-containing protein [Duganella sp. BJB480]
MRLPTHLFPRRRLLILCAATLALHYLAIDWVGERLAAQSHRPSPLPSSLMTAQLRLALPKHVETPPAEEVQPLPPAAKPSRKRKPAPAPEPAPEPAAPPVADSAPAEAPSTAPAPAADASAGAGAQAGAAQAQTGTPSPPDTTGPTPAAALPVEAPPAQGARRYKVNLPPSAKLDMDVARVDADGTKWTGSANMSWQTDGSTYQASAEAGISLLVTRLNLLVMRSAGTIDDYGIAPNTSTQKRARRAETATHFNRDAGTITFSASERSYPLMVGAQDMTTVPFQLGGIGRADVNQFSSDIDMQVGEDKEANMFRFQLVGEEELETRMGKVVTWHLSRPPRPGSYSSRLDIWLAPGLNWYPVQLRNTEASGALTTQTVSKITMSESGK